MIKLIEVDETQEILEDGIIEQTKERIIKLSERLNKTDKPVFIELTGTPKSGKTTLKNALNTSFSQFGIDVVTRRETAEYNPIDKDKNQYDVWMVMELLKNISEDLSKNSGQVIIYDRGILDRIPWMKYDIDEGKMTEKDLEMVTSLYKLSSLDGYRPITKVFKTSPELSVKRKGKPGFFVNERNISRYNNLLDESVPQIKEKSSYSSSIITDSYQGKLKEFIIDNTNDIIDGINQELDRREELDKNERQK